MTTPERGAFPEVLLSRPDTEQTIAMIGLIHVLPPARTAWYDDVAERVDDRLALPASIVHYGGYAPAPERALAHADAATIRKHSQLLQVFAVQQQVIDSLGLVTDRAQLVDRHRTDRWKNHDVTTLQIARRLTFSSLRSQLTAWQDERSAIGALSESERTAYVTKVYHEVADSLEAGPDVHWAAVDHLREKVAISAVMRALATGSRHVTLLCGLGHLGEFQHQFTKRGFQDVAR